MSSKKARLFYGGSAVGGRATTVQQLRDAGYEVHSVKSPSEIKSLTGKAPEIPAIVLVEVSSGAISGVPVRWADAGLPVMVIGGNLHGADLDVLFKNGVQDYLPDPVDFGLLVNRMEMFLTMADGKASLDKLMHDLQHVILPIGIALSVEKDANRLLERILEEAKKLCHADAGTLYLRDSKDTIRFAIMRTDSLGISRGGTTGEEIKFPPLRLYDEKGQPNHAHIATHVALTGKSVNIQDIYNSKDFDWSAAKRFDSKNNYRSTATLTVPLKDSSDAVIGVLQIFNCIDPVTGKVGGFDSYQQLVCESLASQAAIVLSHQALLKSEQELLIVKRDLEIGRQIQSGFIPKELPEHKGWEIAATFTPAREVAGDFYDVFTLGDDRLAFVVADVCDKGVGAALFASLTRSLIRAFAKQCIPTGAACSAKCVVCTPIMIGQFLKKLAEESDVEPMNPMCALNMTNDYLIDVHGSMNMFVTLFFGMIDQGRNQVTYINAGHEAPAIISRDGKLLRRLPPCGPAVGIISGTKYKVETVNLDEGDSLVVFTDGIIDARNEKGEQFSFARLTAACDKPMIRGRDQLDSICRELWDHVGEAAQFDDITLLVLKCLTDKA